MRNQQAGSDGLKVINTHTGHRLRVSCSQLFCWEMMAPAQRREKLFLHHPSLSLAYTCTYKPWCSGHPRSCQERWEFPSSYWKLGLPVIPAPLPNLAASAPSQAALLPQEVLGASAAGGLPLLGFLGAGTVIHPCRQLLSSRRPSLLPNHIRTAFSIRNNCSLYSAAVLIPGLMRDDRRRMASVWEDWSLANKGCTAPALCKPQREQIAAVQAT